jgi:hypothetical protein
VRQRLKNLLLKFRHLVVEYGAIALIVHYVIFAIVIVSFWAAIRLGWKPSDTLANVGAWTAAYIAAKITQPARIVATIALTPFVARIYDRMTGKKRREPSPERRP